jgi:hypothetical protein
MKVAQQYFDAAKGWHVLGETIAGDSAQLVLVFGERRMLESDAPYAYLKKAYPKANIVLASTAGEIAGTEVSEDRIVATALSFGKTRVRCASTDVTDTTGSFQAGKILATQLAEPDLVNVFVISDGQRVNGTELTRGFNESLPAGVVLTGGLAGDGTRFEKTLVGRRVLRQGPSRALRFRGRMGALWAHEDRDTRRGKHPV